MASPWLARRLLSTRLAPDERHELIGDLEEQFREREATDGPRPARRWYWRQALTLMWGFSVHRRDLISTAHERTRGLWAFDNAWLDWRQAARSLRHSPSFATVALVTLTCGIGLSTAVFSLVNSVLLKPLPIRDADRLVRLGQTEVPGIAAFDFMNNGHSGGARLSDVAAGVWQSKSETIAAFAPFSTLEVTVTGLIDAVRVSAADVGPHFFDVFPLKPLIGRVLLPADNAPSAEVVAVVSERFWAQRLGRRSDVVNQFVTLNAVPTRIVGVVPSALDFLEADVEFLRPDHLTYPAPGRPRSFGASLNITGRMKPSVTVDQVRAEGQHVLLTVTTADPGFSDSNVPVPQVRVDRLQDEVTREVKPALTMLMAGIVCVLIAACVNLASLLLSRNTARQQDVAVRLALGASRWRIVRPLLFEQLLLAGVGGALGGVVAWWIIRLLPRFAPPDMPRLADVHFDLPSLAFAAMAALVTAIVVGLMPAWQIPSRSVREFTTSQQAGAFGRGRSAGFARSVLVVCQVTLATVLVVGAVLIGRSLLALIHVDPGYRAEGAIIFQIGMPQHIWADTGHQRQFFSDLEARLTAHPGIIAAGHTSSLPLHGSGGFAGTYSIEGRARSENTPLPRAQGLAVTPGYFAAIGTRLIRGRVFGAGDTQASEPVVLINDVFANRFFPGEDPIGHRLHVYAQVNARIIGIVASARIGALTADAPPAIIQLANQMPEILGYGLGSAGMAVRVTGDPNLLIPFIREQVRALEPGWPVYNVEPLDARLGQTFAQPRFYTIALGFFALLAVSTAVLGLYGVASYAVERRRLEFGIRRALGARQSDIVLQVIARTAVMSAIGLVLGLGATAGAARLMRAVLFGVAPLDPASYAVGIGTISMVVVVASWRPARRALRIDPAQALRVN